MVVTLTDLPLILNRSITALTALHFLRFGLPMEGTSCQAKQQSQQQRHGRMHLTTLELTRFGGQFNT